MTQCLELLETPNVLLVTPLMPDWAFISACVFQLYQEGMAVKENGTSSGPHKSNPSHLTRKAPDAPLPHRSRPISGLHNALKIPSVS